MTQTNLFKSPIREQVRLGYCKPGQEATNHPTTLDIAWAAGIFEGEGHPSFNGNSTAARVGQKDREILDRLRSLFGGSVRTVTAGNLKNTQHYWQVSGARGRGFLMTIYKFMSDRRKEQINQALGYK